MSKTTLPELALIYGATIRESFEWKPHVFPKYLAPVLIEKNQTLEIVPMQFGLIPYFEKNIKPKMVFHNARSETLFEKPSFKKAIIETRCLIPMNYFFEVIWEDEKKNWTGKFFPKDHHLMTAAGIWSLWVSPDGKKINTFSIITREPPPFILNTGHDRCPLFLSKKDFKEWLDPNQKQAPALQQLMAKPENIDFAVERFEKT